jgi:trk system potassium uptake protein TrkH
VGTGILMLPVSAASSEGAPALVALFTAVSAVCVTGLAVVDTATHWSGFGQFVIMLLFQFGGFGFMTAATLVSLLVSRTLPLSRKLVAQAETRSVTMGDVGRILRLVLRVTLVTEAIIAAVLTVRFATVDTIPWGRALWLGVFHSISSFNNAGFALFSDGLMGFAADAWVLVPVMAGVVIGGIGFPVIADLVRARTRPTTWSLHTRLTLVGYAVLLIAGAVLVAIAEWNNPGTFGPMGSAGKVLNATFHSVVARTAGFNAVDIGRFATETLSLSYFLMFVGGGSAGTAGGVKVATVMVLLVAVAAEARGEKDTVAFRRRIPTAAIRQAVAVIVMGLACVVTGTFALLATTDLDMEVVMFEAVSAFATVGLSTGITPKLPPAALWVLMALMYIGRVGTIGLATALALKRLPRLHRYPEERPIIG